VFIDANILHPSGAAIMGAPPGTRAAGSGATARTGDDFLYNIREMDLLPLRTARLSFDLPPAAVADLLRGLIGDGPAATFAGSVAARGFVIRRFNEFRGTAMPRVRGRLVEAPSGGTDVLLSLRPPDVVVVFMAIWLGFLAAVAGLIAGAQARAAGHGLLLLLAPGGLAALSWYLMTSVFAADARWAVESLLAAVPAARVAAPPPGGQRE
jgi:hypothetical protein